MFWWHCCIRATKVGLPYAVWLKVCTHWIQYCASCCIIFATVCSIILDHIAYVNTCIHDARQRAVLPRLAPQYNASHIWCEGTLGLASNVSITSGQNSKNAWCTLFELELLSLSKLHQYVRKIMNYWTSKSCCHYAKVRLHFAASYTTSWTKRFEYSYNK